jgi:hypothetical protein
MSKDERLTMTLNQTDEEEMLQSLWKDEEPEEKTGEEPEETSEEEEEKAGEEPEETSEETEEEPEKTSGEETGEEPEKTSEEETGEEPEKTSDEFEEFDKLAKKKGPPPAGYIEHAAFHAEREKRKALASEIDQLKQTIEELKNRKQEANVEDEVEIPPEVLELKKRQDLLEEQQLQQVEQQRAHNLKQAESKFRSAVAKVNAELNQEGIPGFSLFVNDVAEKVTELSQNSPELGQKLKTEQGWKYVYQKHVYPQMKSIFLDQDKKDLFEEKKALKKEANLINTPRKPEPKPKEKDSWTLEDYESEMKSNSLLRER